MREKIAVAVGFVAIALVIWLATRKKPQPIAAGPAIVSSLVTASASALPPAVPDADLPKYAGGFCEAMERASHPAIAKGSKLAGRAIDDVLPAPSCVDGDRGGWALRVDDAVQVIGEYSPDETELGFEVVLVHRDEHGALTSYPLEHDTWHPEGGPPFDATVTRMMMWGTRSIDRLAAGDIDGDGDPEAFVTGSVHEEGPDPPWTVLATFQGGAIKPFAGVKGIQVIDVDDVDKDGRLDVFTNGAYSGVKAESAFGSSYDPIRGVFLAHTLPDGGFSQDDAVAKDHLKRTCPKKQAVTLPADYIEPAEAVRQIVCARAWGASEADVLKDMLARCAIYKDDYADPKLCPTVLQDAAKTTPIVKLP